MTTPRAMCLLVTMLIPVSAIILGVLFLGKTVSPNQLAGMAVIGLGLAILDGRPWRYLRQRLQILQAARAATGLRIIGIKHFRISIIG